MEFVLLLLNLYFSLTLNIAGLNKVNNNKYFYNTLVTQSIIPKTYIPFVSYFFPVIEVFLAYFLIFGNKEVSLVATLSVLFLFAGFFFVKLVLFFTKSEAKCGCQGEITDKPVDFNSLIVAFIFVALASYQLWLSTLLTSHFEMLRLLFFIILSSFNCWMIFRIIRKQKTQFGEVFNKSSKK